MCQSVVMGGLAASNSSERSYGSACYCGNSSDRPPSLF